MRHHKRKHFNSHVATGVALRGYLAKMLAEFRNFGFGMQVFNSVSSIPQLVLRIPSARAGRLDIISMRSTLI